MRISDWSSDVCSSDLRLFEVEERLFQRQAAIPDDNAGDQGDRHDGTGNPHGCRIWRIGGQAQDCLGREKAQNAAPSRRQCHERVRLIKGKGKTNEEDAQKAAAKLSRSDESRVGKERVSTCRSRWTTYPSKNNKINNSQM